MVRKIIIALGVPVAAVALYAAYLVASVSVPPEAIDASVTRSGPSLDAAMRLPVAQAYNGHFLSQSNSSLCGPASLANVLRSLGKPTTGEADILAGSGLCWTGFCVMGLTLDELATIARARTDRSVAVLRDLTDDDFREHLRRANDPARRYVINFQRKTIFGAGAGHFSPIGGYLEQEDLVLVLDVNPAFQPWLIERSRLFAATDTLDGDKKRGLLLIE